MRRDPTMSKWEETDPSEPPAAEQVACFGILALAALYIGALVMRALGWLP